MHWKIELSVENHLATDPPCFFITADAVEMINPRLLYVNGVQFTFENVKVLAISNEYSMSVIQHFLDNELRFMLNDIVTHRILEDHFPGIDCISVNTPDIIDNQVLRFEYNNVLYEYNPRIKHLFTINAVEDIEYEKKYKKDIDTRFGIYSK
jgi:hypothetical protein